MRKLKPSVLLIATWLCTFTVSAQTDIALENGSRITAWHMREVGDSLATERGRYAKGDILQLVKGKDTYVFNVKSKGLTPVKFKETCNACRMGRIYGSKYSGAMLLLTDLRPQPSLALLADPLFDRFWQEEQNDREQRTPEVKLLADEFSDNSSFTISGNMVITRAGDTLRVDKDFYPMGDTLCWYGGGRMHKDQVFLILNKHGQSVYGCAQKKINVLDEVIFDRSPCSVAIVMANIYNGLSVSGAEMKGVDQAMIADPEFSECFHAEKERLKKSPNNGLRTGSKVLNVVRTVVNLAP